MAATTNVGGGGTDGEHLPIFLVSPTPLFVFLFLLLFLRILIKQQSRIGMLVLMPRQIYRLTACPR